MQKYDARKAYIKKAVCLGIFALVLTGYRSSNAFAADEPVRLSGNNRYETAVAISKEGWKDSSEYIVLARGDNFPDALCAAPLAKKYNAPILLTEQNSIDGSVITEMKRLHVKRILITGGDRAVSKSVEDKLTTDLGVTVDRIAGKDRYETSAKIAERIGGVKEAVLTIGTKFADALSVSPIAAAQQMPILLTEKDKLPEAVAQYLENHKIDQTYIIGGPEVISSAVYTKTSNPKPIGGKDRYETNVNIIKAFEGKIDFSSIYMAVGDGPKGNEFADALAGAALAAKTGAPLLLTSTDLPAVTEQYMQSKKLTNVEVKVLGGEKAVQAPVVSELLSVVQTVKNPDSGTVENQTPSTEPGGTIPVVPGNTGTTTGNTGTTPSSGGNTSPFSAAELTTAKQQLAAIASIVTNTNEKAILTRIQSTIDMLLSNPSYDYSGDVTAVKQMKDALTTAEKLDLLSAAASVLSSSDWSAVYSLMTQFGF